MRIKPGPLAWAAAALLLLAAAAWAQEPSSPGAGYFVKKNDVMERSPDAELGAVRVWSVEKTSASSSLLVQLNGALAPHYHPDGAHRIYILEGRVRVRVGDKEEVLGPGDYAMIPMGVPHRLESLGGRKALYGTVDAPPIDPGKIVWLEPLPGSKGGEECRVDHDCMPARCCHANSCVPKSRAPDCSAAFCTQDCRGQTMDCGGRCACREGRCAALGAEGGVLP